MKKIISLLLVLVMAISISACSGEKAEKTTPEKPTVETTQESTEVITQEPIEAVESAKEFSLGTVNGNVYTNEFIGIEFTADSDWKYKTNEEMAEANKIAKDLFSDDFAEAIKDADVVYAMSAGNEYGDNVNIIMEKILAGTSRLVNIPQVYQKVVSEMETAYKNMGATSFDYTIEKVLVDGRNMDGIKIKAEIQGFALHQICFSKICGDYMVNVTISTSSESEAKEILNKFKWID